VHGVDEANHAVLHQIADVHATGHRRRDPARQSFHEGATGKYPILLVFAKWLQHVQLSCQVRSRWDRLSLISWSNGDATADRLAKQSL
jgi:hypothetical protein